MYLTLSLFPLSASNALSIIRPVTGSLSGKVNLPCYFSTIPTSAPVISPNGTTIYNGDYLRIKWTKIEGEVESTVLVAQNGFIKIGSSYRNRVSVPSHPEDVGDASLTVVKLRASDAGTYRCEVMYGIEDTQDTVNLDVNGKRFMISHVILESDKNAPPRYSLNVEGSCCKSLIIVKCNTSGDRNVNRMRELWAPFCFDSSNYSVVTLSNHSFQFLF